MSAESSYRTILRSSSIMGGSSFLNIVAGLGKMKAAALLLGPAGVGLIGMYQNLIQTAATVSALGLGTVGTRQVAVAQASDSVAFGARTRRALFWGTLGLALLGAAAFWLASGWIADHLLRAPQLTRDVEWLSVGVALTVASGSQAALLTGLRRIGDVARVQVFSGMIGAALGIGAIWIWGLGGLVLMVLVAPVVTFLTGYWYVARLGQPAPARRTPMIELAGEWRSMAALGVAFMLSGVVATVGQLAVRTIVQRDLGTEGLGQFQASWAIGMTYLGFILTSMGTDYFPRLTAAIPDRSAASRMVNEQTEVALLLCAPVALAMMALAPWVIRLLYSGEFTPAVGILRWQILGDILKVMSWPLGFVLIAAGAGKTFILTESVAMGVFVAGAQVAIPAIGVTAAGMAFLAMYVGYLPLVFLLARRRIGFRWTAPVIRYAVALGLAGCIVDGAARVSNLVSLGIGLPAALGFGIYGLARLGRMGALDGKLGVLAKIIQPVVLWTRRPL